MRAFARDLVGLTLLYVVGVFASFGWILLGVYVYTRPLPPNTFFDADFNHDIGTALVAQGLIFFVTFAVALVIRSVRGNREQNEQSQDRQMLREMHQWMVEQRNNNVPPGVTP
jgi:ABC-type Fe3+ transport system permease subunit